MNGVNERSIENDKMNNKRIIDDNPFMTIFISLKILKF